MRTDVRPDVRPLPSDPVRTARRAPLALAPTGLVLAVGPALSGAVSVVRDGGGYRVSSAMGSVTVVVR